MPPSNIVKLGPTGGAVDRIMVELALSNPASAHHGTG